MNKINNFSIRVGKMSDLGRIVELEKRNWPPTLQVDREEFEKRIKTHTSGFLVIVNLKGEIVGTSTAFLFSKEYSVTRLNNTSSKTVLHDPKGKVYYLHAISIDKDYRGKGLGRFFVHTHENNAKKFNCKKIYLIAAESEAGFYEKLGYSRISEYSRYKDTKMAGFEKLI